MAVCKRYCKDCTLGLESGMLYALLSLAGRRFASIANWRAY